MEIAIVEGSLSGHRLTFVLNYLDCLLNMGHKVHLFCPKITFENKQIENYNVTHHFYELTFKPELKHSRYSTITKINLWRKLNKQLSNAIPSLDLVFIVSLDDYRFTIESVLHPRLNFNKRKLRFLRRYRNLFVRYLLDTIFKYKWAGLSITPTRQGEDVIFANNCKAFCVLDETYSFQQKELNEKLLLLPDITDTKINKINSELTRTVIKKASGRRIISLLGSIDKRKSVFTLIDTAQICSGKKRYFFVFAGESRFDSYTSEEIDRLKELEKNQPENCFFHFERINDGSAFNELLMVSDIIFASYLNFPNSSNLLTKISYFKKPVIVSNYGIMGIRVKKFNLGVTMKEGFVSEVIKSIDSIINNYRLVDYQYESYYKMHSENQLKNTFEVLLNRLKF